MKKEYVVRSIDAAPDGAPYVIVSLSSVKDFKEGTQNHNLLLAVKSYGIFKYE